MAGKGGGDGAGERADGERLAQQLVAPQVVAFAFADIAGDEQHREVAGAVSTSDSGSARARSSRA